MVEDIGTDTMVSIDGTWRRRGHSSRNGVVTVINAATGKVLDSEILRNYCRICELTPGKEHNCMINHSGSAGAMEAVRLFSRSEVKCNLRYTEYLGDGDTSAFSKVKESKPYGDQVIIEKRECIGHVHKRVGGRLRKLKQKHRRETLSDGKGIGGKGRLTDVVINKLQNYCVMAIRENLDSIVKMQSNMMASLYHVAASKENPDHTMCPENGWCKFRIDPENY